MIEKIVDGIGDLLKMAEKLAESQGNEGAQEDIEKMKEGVEGSDPGNIGDKLKIQSGIRGQIFGKPFGGGPVFGGRGAEKTEEFKTNFKKPTKFTEKKSKKECPKVELHNSELDLELHDEGDIVKVIGEMPGVEKKDIKCEIDGPVLKIHTTGKRKYEGEIKLPVSVNQKFKPILKYKNGVLEITLKKAS